MVVLRSAVGRRLLQFLGGDLGGLGGEPLPDRHPPALEHDAAGLDFDVLVNNAGIGESGPISEIPMDLVRQNFEVNVFTLLDLTQRVVKRWVRSQTTGKVVFQSSILGPRLEPTGSSCMPTYARAYAIAF